MANVVNLVNIVTKCFGEAEFIERNIIENQHIYSDRSLVSNATAHAVAIIIQRPDTVACYALLCMYIHYSTSFRVLNNHMNGDDSQYDMTTEVKARCCCLHILFIFIYVGNTFHSFFKQYSAIRTQLKIELVACLSSMAFCLVDAFYSPHTR